MTYALKFAKAAPAIAMSYLSVVWGLLGGYAFFHEVTITAEDLCSKLLPSHVSVSSCLYVAFVNAMPWLCYSCLPSSCMRLFPPMLRRENGGAGRLYWQPGYFLSTVCIHTELGTKRHWDSVGLLLHPCWLLAGIQTLQAWLWWCVYSPKLLCTLTRAPTVLQVQSIV